MCLCLSSLCNETPKVSEGHSGVSEGEGGQEVSPHCCAPVQTVALCFRLSRLGKFTAGRGGKEFSVHFSPGSKVWRRGGGLDGGSTCSPYVPEADDCWEVTGEEAREGEGWRDKCTLGLYSCGLSDDPASVNVHISVL